MSIQSHQEKLTQEVLEAARDSLNRHFISTAMAYLLAQHFIRTGDKDGPGEFVNAWKQVALTTLDSDSENVMMLKAMKLEKNFAEIVDVISLSYKNAMESVMGVSKS